MRAKGGIWIIGGGVLGVLIVVLGWFGMASPLLDQAAAADSQRETIDAQNDTERAVLAQMKEQYESLDELEEQLEELRLSVPGTRDLDSYFAQLEAAAGAAGVVLQGVTVETAIPYTSVTTAVVAEPEETETDAEAEESTEAPTAEGGTSTQQSELGAPTLPTGDLSGNLYVLPVTIDIMADATQATALLASLQSGRDRLMLVNGVQLTLGSTLSGSLTGFIFVVHDPSTGEVGSLPEPEPTETPTPTPTPTPSGTVEPTPSGTPTP